MGLPINNYSLLKAISDKDEAVMKMFFRAEFSLYGFIIHDPSQQKSLSALFDLDFQKFNIISGKHFLFTAIADPPKSWIEWSRNHSKFRNLDFWDSKKLEDPNLIIKTINPSYTAAYMANILKINYHYLPVIVISPDLQSNTYYFFKTSEYTFQDQITDLNFVSQELKNGKDFDELLGLLTKYNPKKIVLDKGNLVEKLLDLSNELVQTSNNKEKLEKLRVLQGNWLTEKNSEIVERKDEEATINALLSPNAINRDIKKEDAGILSVEILLEHAISFQEEFHLNDSLIADLTEENKDLLEAQTLIYMEEGIELLGIYNHTKDASPYIIQFAKALELELSYSLVHWVRNNYGIMLPEYFYEFEPQKNAVVTMRNVQIDFNEEKNQQWKVPMIGSQILGFQWAAELKSINPFNNVVEYNRFLEILRSMKNVRNRACHMDRTKDDDLYNIVSGWEKLFQGPYIKLLAELKEEYRNHDL